MIFRNDGQEILDSSTAVGVPRVQELAGDDRVGVPPSDAPANDESALGEVGDDRLSGTMTHPDRGRDIGDPRLRIERNPMANLAASGASPRVYADRRTFQ